MPSGLLSVRFWDVGGRSFKIGVVVGDRSPKQQSSSSCSLNFKTALCPPYQVSME
ncbi:hypothetical protein VB711_13130 [Cronbergia sp. UHCC 0137]|uniref:hypothetical protein n=1 Tax=Cronbergia sp. UHCC 0137 TaxID=3110239 RepID=UPI002B2067F5|nr:hypothetical protein [Cronbergia sp. UHCC 0137]MEA5618774.1 hypothetical protein [Cronbergia sp. UHCC 0137]